MASQGVLRVHEQNGLMETIKMLPIDDYGDTLREVLIDDYGYGDTLRSLGVSP